MDYWLVIGSSGEPRYCEEWPVAIYETEEEALAAAEGAGRHAREQRAIHDTWHRENYPWFLANPLPRKSDEEAYRAWERDCPREPNRPTNPYDPEHGRGDEYFVKCVPLRKLP